MLTFVKPRQRRGANPCSRLHELALEFSSEYNVYMKKVPKRLQGILWSVDTKHLDVKKDRAYIIYQVLLYGTLDEIRWLFNIYSKREIIDVFLRKSIKIYPRATFYFVKDFILDLRNIRLPEERYVTAISGPIEPRAASSVQET